MIDHISKKQLFIILIAIIGLIGILIIAISIKENSNQIVINNFDKYTKSLPSERRTALNKALYNVIEKSSQIKNYKNDAMIRDKSYSEIYNNSEKTYQSVFIIDLASVKQSYKVYITWSKDSKIELKGDNLKFDCLSKNELIYGDFNCSKILGTSKTNDDPITQHLPYSTFNYTIALGSTTNNITELNINIYLYSSDIRNGNSETAISNYKTNVINWIKSKNLDPNNYILTYKIHQ